MCSQWTGFGRCRAAWLGSGHVALALGRGPVFLAGPRGDNLNKKHPRVALARRSPRSGDACPGWQALRMVFGVVHVSWGTRCDRLPTGSKLLPRRTWTNPPGPEVFAMAGSARPWAGGVRLGWRRLILLPPLRRCGGHGLPICGLHGAAPL